MDKYIMTSCNDGKFYCYSSTIPNSEGIKEVEEKTVRAVTIISA